MRKQWEAVREVAAGWRRLFRLSAFRKENQNAAGDVSGGVLSLNAEDDAHTIHDSFQVRRGHYPGLFFQAGFIHCPQLVAHSC